ncbi:MAG: cyclic nucleotide-binding domain-containing protein [Arachidicoccus sp.]|nr:cyclic nucleotide-binding domain-containing protein [Arachidicoccus sp.]
MMFETFEKYLTEKAALTTAEVEAVCAVSIEKKIRKRQYLLQEGDVCHYNCFIAKGCMRFYRVGEDGTEHILRFGVENWWMSDQESYNTGKPSKNNIDALEHCEVILIDKQDFIHLKTSIPKLGNFIEELKARSYDASQNRILSNISNTAEEKYQTL